MSARGFYWTKTSIRGIDSNFRPRFSIEFYGCTKNWNTLCNCQEKPLQTLVTRPHQRQCNSVQKLCRFENSRKLTSVFWRSKIQSQEITLQLNKLANWNTECFKNWRFCWTHCNRLDILLEADPVDLALFLPFDLWCGAYLLISHTPKHLCIAYWFIQGRLQVQWLWVPTESDSRPTLVPTFLQSKIFWYQQAEGRSRMLFYRIAQVWLLLTCD